MMIQNIIFAFAPFLAVITVIVTIHELGHFLTARAFGVAVDRFSIGFGRALAKWTDRAGVEWRISWIPLGGYVRFAGDENVASVPDSEDLADMRARIIAEEGAGAERKYLHFKPLWQRALIVAAGPAANFVLSIAIFAAIFATVGAPMTPFSVGRVAPGSSAARAGFMIGDRIKAADGHEIDGFQDLAQYVSFRDGVAIRFEVERAGRTFDLTATPGRQQVKTLFGDDQSAGLLGIGARPDGVWRNVRQDPITALGGGVRETWRVLSLTVFNLGRVITGHVSPSQLHGVIGIAKASGAITRDAIDQSPRDIGNMVVGVAVNLLAFVAVISVGIGFMNLLPMPILDGGHLVFYAYEWIARRPVAAATQAAGYRVGLALLVSLMLFAAWNDLQPLRVFHFLGSLFS